MTRLLPDGTNIAFAANRHQQEWPAFGARWEIYVMNADGSNETRIANVGGYAPTFSPDGDKIAFADDTYLFEQRGSRYDENSGSLPYTFVDIYVINGDGSDRTRLTNYSSALDSHPDWLVT